MLDQLFYKKENNPISICNLKLKYKNKITINKKPFKLLVITKIDSLIINSTFRIMYKDNINLNNIKIFNSYLINKIKNKNKILYKKSHLII